MYKFFKNVLIVFMISSSFLCNGMSSMGAWARGEDPLDRTLIPLDPEDAREAHIQKAIREYQAAKNKVIRIYRENVAAGLPYNQQNFIKAFNICLALASALNDTDPEYVGIEERWGGRIDGCFVGRFDVYIQRNFIEEDGGNNWISLEDYNELVKDSEVAKRQKDAMRAKRLRKEAKKNRPWYRRLWPWNTDQSFEGSDGASASTEDGNASLLNDSIISGSQVDEEECEDPT